MLLASPVTVIGEAGPDAEALNAPAVQVAVKLVMGEPPSQAGVNEILARPMPGVAVPIVGAQGTVGANGPPMKRPKAIGSACTATVATTVLVAVSITETVLGTLFAT